MIAKNPQGVSVVIPTYNTPLPLLIRSIESALRQDSPPLEVIVVDDGSNEDHAAKVAEYCSQNATIQLRRQANLGVSIARNTGIRMALGEFICFLDADDTLRPEFFSEATRVARSTQADAVFGGMAIHRGPVAEQWRSLTENCLSDHGEIERARVGALTFTTTPSGRPDPTSLINAAGALFRTNIARTVRFRPEVAHAEDRLFVSDFLSHSSTVALVSSVWYDYIISSSSATQSVAPSSAAKLPATIHALASVASEYGPEAHEDSGVGAAAADGAFKYAKLFLQLVGKAQHREEARRAVAELLDDPKVAAALSHTLPRSRADRVLRHLAIARRVNALLAISAAHNWIRRVPSATSSARKQLPAYQAPLAQSMRISQPSVGLIVHYSNSNYGNHLVNYASVRVLEHCGFTTTLLNFTSERRSLLETLQRLPRKLLRLGLSGTFSRLQGRLRRGIDSLRHPKLHGLEELGRAQRFSAFAQQHFELLSVHPRGRRSLLRAFDRFAIGGDQIWNFDHSARKWHFADFAGDQAIPTLAPSVGHASIPTEWLSYYRRQLRRFSEFGTREAEWLDSFGPRAELPSSQLLIDPTLMLDAVEWRQLAGQSQVEMSGILVYTLGPLLSEQVEFINEVSRTSGLPVTHLSPQVGGEIWDSDAADFLALLDQCTTLITDSFHGAALSFLFDKPMTIFPRHGFARAMNTRIDTLANHLHLQDRFFPLVTPEQALRHDYSSGQKKLIRLRLQFWDYLQRCGFTRETDQGEDHAS